MSQQFSRVESAAPETKEGWQKMDSTEAMYKVNWTGDLRDWMALIRQAERMGLVKNPFNARSRGDMRWSFSPEFFKKCEDAKDGLFAFHFTGLGNLMRAGGMGGFGRSHRWY